MSKINFDKNDSETKYDSEAYRDRIATVDDDGNRVFIHPTKPKGRFYNWRKIVGYFLLALMILMPLIKVDGNQFIMLNFIERKFVIFGIVFWPQDTFLLLIMMLSFLVFIILFTVTFGRIWCGWACPQTIFLELIFRPIEFLIDGSPASQKKLKKQQWNSEKIIKRIIKFLLFYSISIVLVNVILWYFMGFDKWLNNLVNYNEHLIGITVIFVFTTIFFLIYWSFREQICIIACPYGRMQGVLIDPNTIVISYDFLRGEPRGHRKIKDIEADEKLGDCVDCGACVKVCPTGIDIRNGTQLECVNCTACIDACDSVMDAYGKKRGLIKYASQNQITSGHFKLKPRVIAYSIVLLALLTFFFSLLIGRSDVETSIIRTPNILYQEVGNDSIQNLYNIKAINKSNKDINLSVGLKDIEGSIRIVGNTLNLKADKKTESVLFIVLPKTELKGSKFSINVEVFADNELVEEKEVTFIAP
jgi:cytochrome c oxidase accessory protein FixG